MKKSEMNSLLKKRIKKNDIDIKKKDDDNTDKKNKVESVEEMNKKIDIDNKKKDDNNNKKKTR